MAIAPLHGNEVVWVQACTSERMILLLHFHEHVNRMKNVNSKENMDGCKVMPCPIGELSALLVLTYTLSVKISKIITLSKSYT